MKLSNALEQEKAGNVTNYRTYLYKTIKGEMVSEVFKALDAEEAMADGWHMSPVDAMNPDKLKKAALESTKGFDMTEEAKEKAFTEMIIDNTVITNRILNIDEITDVETLKEMAGPLNYKGKPLCDKINFNMKGKRKLEHVKRDLKKCLNEMGLLDDNSKADN